jgi:phosphoribosylformylglycinamidine synthase I
MDKAVGVVVFPGTNCEHDVVEALVDLGVPHRLIWHRETDLMDLECVIIPGGFAHGDYLRPGAIAKFSPVMKAVSSFATSGRSVLGICNGFQVLTEAKLLEGALQKNAGLSFICDVVECEVASRNSPVTSSLELGEKLRLPINHFEGNYTCAEDDLKRLLDEDRIILRYVDNPNGSIGDIAAICNKDRNIVGMMPHPERAMSDLLGSSSGRKVLASLLERSAVFS